MKKIGSAIFTLFLLMSCDPQDSRSSSDLTNDEAAINRSIEDWDNAWATKNLDLAIKHYANETDWTNAFGDRVRSKDELEELLGFIFNLDFVMAGENEYGKSEITFLNKRTATVRSQNIRKNQKWADGSLMEDRYVNHLRVYQKIDGIWLITNHMISQEHKKGNKAINDSNHLSIIDSYFEGLRNGKISSIPLADEVNFLGPSVSEVIKGKEAVAEHLANVSQRFIGSEFKIKEHSITENGAFTLFEIEMNNGALVVPIVDHFELEEGKIQKIRPYFDPRPFIAEFDRRLRE